MTLHCVVCIEILQQSQNQTHLINFMGDQNFRTGPYNRECSRVVQVFYSQIIGTLKTYHLTHFVLSPHLNIVEIITRCSTQSMLKFHLCKNKAGGRYLKLLQVVHNTKQ